MPRTGVIYVTTEAQAAGYRRDDRRFGGRWNPAGLAMVYTSQHLSLAALELLVHVDSDLVPTDMVALAVSLPRGARVETVSLAELPADWRRSPAPETLAAIGASWAARGTSLTLSVPSAVIPNERNLLVNPAHTDASRLRLGEPEPFALDPRSRQPTPSTSSP